ncbi:MAG: NAD(P)H-hydrate dehydratase [Bacteroidetes bacterium]|nr:NAD(P)H-hydrate dehydratase [Bacteroidota bacterium]
MIPLFSTNQIREVDEYAINKLGIPGLVLMENAAIQIFTNIIEKTNHLTRRNNIGIVCGKGNNGGDGFAAARHFANHGFKVNVIYLGDENEMSPDCLSNYKTLSNLAEDNQKIFLKKYTSGKDLKIIEDSDIILDAMLGSGSQGSLREAYKSIVEALNKMKSFKVAVDIPTGLNSETGFAEICFNADLTVTLGEFKKGLFFEDGFVNSGVIEKGDIGIGFSFFNKLKTSEYLIEPEDALNNLPIKKKNIHKYSSGKVLTIAGSGALPGAAVMTVKAALKVGAGASILCFPKSVRKLIFNKASEVVVNSYEDDGKEFLSRKNIKELEKKLEWADALAIGPGLGRQTETQEAVLEILKKKKCKRIVVDADGIYALNDDRYRNVDLESIILTPHHGEFANLIDIDISELKKNILYYGKKFVEETGSYLVLKGAPTIIFTPNGDVLINTTGNPGMAKFGTGDVLTGTIAGLLSQLKDQEKAAIAGVYIHSLAADLLVNDFSEFGYTATDIIKKLPAAINFLSKSINLETT